MQFRTLGDNGPNTSALGLGCMRMSHANSRDSETERESIATIEAALEAGITFLDTGDFYGMGHNEMLIARAIHNRRDERSLA